MWWVLQRCKICFIIWLLVIGKIFVNLTKKIVLSTFFYQQFLLTPNIFSVQICFHQNFVVTQICCWKAFSRHSWYHIYLKRNIGYHQDIKIRSIDIVSWYLANFVVNVAYIWISRHMYNNHFMLIFLWIIT